jgi:hypothetical protein
MGLNLFFINSVNSVSNHVEISIAQIVTKPHPNTLTGLTPPLLCVYPKPWLVVLSCVQLRWEVIV